MAKWKNGRCKSWSANNNSNGHVSAWDAESTQPMLNGTAYGEDDDYLRPALRYALAQEKRDFRTVAIMTLISFLLLVAIGTCIILTMTQTYACPVCETVENAMDLNTDPCQDFYQYSCGKWGANTHIPEGHSRWGSFSQVYSQNKLLLQKLLEEDGYDFNGTYSTALKKAKDHYQACMNETAIELAGSEPLKQLLNRLGGWSILPTSTPGLVEWDESEFDLTEAVIASHRQSAGTLFSLYISPDERNSSVNMIQFYQSGLGLAAPELYSDNDTTHEEAYVALGAKVVVLLSLAKNEVVTMDDIESHPNYAPALQRMEEIIEFEANMSDIFIPKADLIDPAKSYYKTTVQELNDTMSQIDMSHYLNEMLEVDVPSDEVILVAVHRYLQDLDKLLEQTSDRLIADYLTWHVVTPLLKYLPKIYEDVLTEYGSVMTGSNSTLPLWENCVKRIDNDLGFITGALFVREVATPLQKNETQDLIEYIRDAFVGNLPSVSWMDDDTKEAARDKAEAIKTKIGFPAWIEDPAQLDEYYANLNITDYSPFENVMNLKEYYQAYRRSQYGKPVDRTEWDMSPAKVNAYYSSSFNEIVFPTGILQAPYYDSSRPMSMNFGAIGMVMGHELTHGFDNHGRKFDKFGNMRDWWGNSSVLAYENKTKCMIDQYSDYKIGNSHLNGLYTLGENIADNGGLKIALEAYHVWLTEHKESRRLRGLDLSDDQLFFLGFSQVWCSFSTPEYAEMAILIDSHSAEKYRVNGAVSNMPEFTEAFSCPVGSPMNPVDKCDVW